MAAHELVHAGLDVLMLERGDWVPRGPHNWDDAGIGRPHAVLLARGAVPRGRRRATGPSLGSYSCVGGPSVFYGGVSIRFREADFVARSRHRRRLRRGLAVRLRRARALVHARAKQLLGVAGRADEDPTEPRREHAVSHTSPARCPTRRRASRARPRARAVAVPACRSRSTTPTADGRTPCVACTTCDTFACAIGAKNDLATTVLPALVARGLELRANTVVTSLVAEDGRVEGVECYDKRSGRRERVRRGTCSSPRARSARRTSCWRRSSTRVNPAGQPRRPPPHAALQRDRVRRVPGVARIRAVSSTSRSASTTSTSGTPTSETPLGKLGSIQQLRDAAGRSRPRGAARARSARSWGLRSTTSPACS